MKSASHRWEVSKFMTSQPGQETITKYILLNMSRSKDNQAMKCQTIEDNKRNIFFQISCRKWAKETSCRPLFIFKKAFIWGKSKWSGA